MKRIRCRGPRSGGPDVDERTGCLTVAMMVSDGDAMIFNCLPSMI